MNAVQFTQQHNALQAQFNAFMAALRAVSTPFNPGHHSFLLAQGTSFFSFVEAFLVGCTNPGLTKAQAKDAALTAQNVLEAAIVYWEMLREIGNAVGIPTVMGPQFLATAQGVLKFHRRCDARRLRKQWEDVGLPSAGFKGKGIDLKQESIVWPPLIIGSLLIAASAFFAFWKIAEDGVQYYVIRVFASLGAGLLLASFKHRLKIEMKFGGVALTAAGAAGAVVLFYLINPAPPPEYPHPQLKGGQPAASAPAASAPN